MELSGRAYKTQAVPETAHSSTQLLFNMQETLKKAFLMKRTMIKGVRNSIYYSLQTSEVSHSCNLHIFQIRSKAKAPHWGCFRTKCSNVNGDDTIFIALQEFFRKLQRASITHLKFGGKRGTFWTCNLECWLVAMAKAWRDIHGWITEQSATGTGMKKTLQPTIYTSETPRLRHKMTTNNADAFCVSLWLFVSFS